MRPLDVLNFTLWNGMPIRMIYSYRDLTFCKSGTRNIFCKNFDKAIEHKTFHDTFFTFRNILSYKEATNSDSQLKGYDFAKFENKESMQKTIRKLKLLNDKQVYLWPFPSNKRVKLKLARTNSIMSM